MVCMGSYMASTLAAIQIAANNILPQYSVIRH
jgi:hypothetical protein